ncbi:hypothetical protein GGX14DRAFT_437648, partial [Mycena pura]
VSRFFFTFSTASNTVLTVPRTPLTYGKGTNSVLAVTTWTVMIMGPSQLDFDLDAGWGPFPDGLETAAIVVMRADMVEEEGIRRGGRLLAVRCHT